MRAGLHGGERTKPVDSVLGRKRTLWSLHTRFSAPGVMKPGG